MARFVQSPLEPNAHRRRDIAGVLVVVRGSCWQPFAVNLFSGKNARKNCQALGALGGRDVKIGVRQAGDGSGLNSV